VGSRSEDSEYGEAISFYTVRIRGEVKMVVVFVPLTGLQRPFPTVLRGRWPEDESANGAILALELGSIETIVGIWEYPQTKNIYILPKHPAYSFLRPEDLGLVEEMERDKDSDED
jgi:hypothetical protein